MHVRHNICNFFWSNNHNKKTTLKLNNILIEIRINFRFTNENFEIKNKNFTRKLQKKITIFMKIHLFFRLNIKKFRNVRMFFFRSLKISRKKIWIFVKSTISHLKFRKQTKFFIHEWNFYIFSMMLISLKFEIFRVQMSNLI